MAPLPFVPLANTLPAVAIILLCLGIAERDGLMLALGYFVAVVSAVYIGSLMWLVVRVGMNADVVLNEAGAYLSRIFRN
jgi:hypothetical protein